MEFPWLLTACLGFLIFSLVYLLIRNSNYWEKQRIRCISSSPVDFVVNMIFWRKGLNEIIHDFYKKLEGDKLGGLFNFSIPVIVLGDPELINHILIKDFTYFEDRSPPMGDKRDLMSLSLGNLTGDEWRHARHKLTPTFTSGKLKLMFVHIKECSDDIVRFLETKTDQDLEAKELGRKFLLKVIGSIVYGINIDSINDNDEKNDDFMKYTKSFLDPSLGKLIMAILSMAAPRFFGAKFIDSDVDNFFRNLSKDVIKFREKSGEKRNDFLQLMIDEKKKEEAGLRNDFDRSENIESEDKELIDQLKNMKIGSIASSKSGLFTDEFIAAQAFGFISAGSDTASVVLSFILYEMAVNQDIQKRLQKEVCDVLSSREFNYETVSKIHYLEQFIFETLRMHPILAQLTRACTHDYKIPGMESIIKKGSLISIPVIGLHMDPHYFPEPETFNPDRFEDMKAIPKGVFFPFGGGPRFCIAMPLAMLELKIFITAILSNFTVHLSKKQKLPLKIKKYSFMGEVDGGIWIVLKKKEV